VSRWYRAYEGTVTDGKLTEAALVAGVSRSVSIAAWHCLLESAAVRNNCGGYETSARRIASILCEPLERIEALVAAYEEIGLVGEGAVKAWRKRQFQSDDSKERVAKHRAKKRQETADTGKRNAHETPGNGDVTPPDAESEEEESPNGDSPSDDGPNLVPEHVFEGYQELADSIGLAVPRDFTPERRQLVRGRITQYPLTDFQAAFAKCRDSPFLRGDRGRTPLTFDWLMKKGNFQKVLEGNYDR
jgi:hypothetical protein